MQNHPKTTPSFSTQPATLSDRLLAFNIDLIVLLGLFYALGYIIERDISLYLSCLCLYIVYDWLFTTSPLKGTPGKKLTKLRVTDPDGKNLNLSKCLLRAILKIPSAGILFAGYLMIFYNDKKQGLHDKLTGAYVSRIKNHSVDF